MRAVAVAAPPREVRPVIFAAAPLIVSDYIDGSAALALEWYEERREEASAPSPFTPKPHAEVRDMYGDIAWATGPLHEVSKLEVVTDALLARAVSESLDLLDGVVQVHVASGFWDTVTGNVAADPDAVGWQRYARPGACKFCVMVAGRGAVYRKSTANFAAHKNCHCVAGPAYDPEAPRASAMQYLAAGSNRTKKQKAELRAYLNENFPDAPG